MAACTISKLAKPPKQFHPGKVTPSDFETKEDCREEDRYRIGKLQAHLDGISSPYCFTSFTERKVDLDRLAKTLGHIQAASGLASSLYMRKHRIRIAGELWRHFVCGPLVASTFTLMPRRWLAEPGTLHSHHPRKLLKRLRQALIRSGATVHDGWIFIGLHGEFDPTEKCYRLHVHGIAFGPVIAAVDRLRKSREFKRSDGVYRPIRIQGNLTDLPHPLTYLLQSFWPSKATFRAPGGNVRRERTKHRIPEPHHSEVLSWLDQWRLEDVTLLIGATCKKKGIRMT